MAVTSSETVLTVDPTSDPRWSRLVESRRSDIFHAPGWLRALSATYDLPIEARVLVDAGEVPRAGFVYSPISDLMDPRLVSLPFSDFCDPLVDDVNQWRLLTTGLSGRGHRAHMRILHCDVALEDDWLSRCGRAHWHAVDVTRASDDIWAAIDPSARRSIRKARKQEVSIRAAEELEDVRAFFEMHLRVRKHKYGLLAQPWAFFEQIWHELLSRDGGVLLLAVSDDQVVAGVLFLEWRDTLYYKFNASEADGLGVRPNDLIVWEGIRHAQERGLRFLDFGVSDWDHEGLVRFKRKYATVEKEVAFLEHLPPEGRSDRESGMRELLPAITGLLTQPTVPDEITEQAGDVLYRYFT